MLNLSVFGNKVAKRVRNVTNSSVQVGNTGYRGHHHTLTVPHTDFSLVPTDAEALESASCGPAKNLSNTPEQEQTVTLGNTPPSTAQMVPPDSTSPGPDENINQTER